MTPTQVPQILTQNVTICANMLASCPAFAWRAASGLVPLPWKRIAAAAKWAHFAPWALLEVRRSGRLYGARCRKTQGRRHFQPDLGKRPARGGPRGVEVAGHPTE